ncbi:MAG: response regulator [Flavobacteriales bacterium]|nr:response regulator [Flavobacteriales bacterium]
MNAIALLVSAAMPLLSGAQHDTLRLPFRALTIEDGLSQGMVNAIMEDRFGFLWFATKDGLNRYDGYSFKVYRNDAADSTTLRENYITALSEGTDGALWVGTASKGLDVMDRRTERFRHVDLGSEGNASYVYHVVNDEHGNVWVATDKGLFKVDRAAAGPQVVRRYFTRQCRMTKDLSGKLWCYLFATGNFRIHPAAEGPDRIDTLSMEPLRDGPWNTDPNTNVNGNFLVHPANGRVFAMHPYFIAEYDTSTLQPRIIHQVQYPGGSRLEFDQAAIDANGVIWIPSVELWRFDVNSHRMSQVQARDPGLASFLRDVSVSHLDGNGLLWVGTKGYGILTYDTRTEHLRARLDGSVYWMQGTRDGRMICQRPGTFLRVFDPKLGRYVIDLKDNDPQLRAQFQGLMPETHAAIMDDDGSYWMSKGALIHFDPITRKVTHHPLQDADGRQLARRKGFFPLIPEGKDLLWFGTDSAFCMFDKRTGRYTHHRYPIVPRHTPYLFAQAAHMDADRVLWIGTVSGLLRLDPATGAWTHHRHDAADSSSLSFDLIFSILPDPAEPERYLWIGTNGGGLNRFDKRSGRCDRFGIRDGLPNDVIYGMLADAKGRLWMSTNKGICRFDPRTRAVRNFDARDGLQGDEFNRNAFCSLDDGTFFFGGVQGFNQFAPMDLEDDDQQAMVTITDIKVLNRSLSFGGPDDRLDAPAFLARKLTIPHSANMITFQFANMDLAHPERNEFRYQLQGFDPEPIESGTSNNAVYTNLDPGGYTFRVWGRKRNGEWGEPPASFSLVITPPWWRTGWFYALMVLAVAGAVVLYIRNVRRQRRKLEMTVRVRTHELSREKDRSDELLKNILPAEIAAELKRMGQAEARHYDQVTILFSDFVGFTGISEQLAPAELVDELNVCFNAFDRIMEKYGIEKIKTIGDAYMAAGGVPEPSEGMPQAAVQAALEMQEIMAERKAECDALGRPAFTMRVGIHTGPVVAGIVGRRKFQYDVWGDTVNIASRMESAGEAGRVNISGGTYALVKDEPGLHFVARGKVKAKGKGDMDMYFVTRDQATGVPTMAASAHATRPSGEEPQQIRGLMLKELRILLAEDNSFNVMVAQDELEDLIPGVRVDVASNGEEAVARVREQRYDVVLMDVQMPVLDGYQATRAIRAMRSEKARVPIIALTANVMQAEVDRCMEAGMDAFVPKPFKREELMAALQRVLARTGTGT